MSISDLSKPFESSFSFIADTAEKTTTVTIACSHEAFFCHCEIRVRVGELLIVVRKVLQVPIHERSACPRRVEREREDAVTLDGVN